MAPFKHKSFHAVNCCTDNQSHSNHKYTQDTQTLTPTQVNRSSLRNNTKIHQNLHLNQQSSSMVKKYSYNNDNDDNNNVKLLITRMWADAQRDGRPAEYR